MRNHLIIRVLLLTFVFSAACSLGPQVAEERKPSAAAASVNDKDALRKNVEEKINGMLVAQLQLDRSGITPDARLIEDLKADELDVVELIMRVEEGFEIEIPDDDARSLNRVREFYDYVEKRLREKAR